MKIKEITRTMEACYIIINHEAMKEALKEGEIEDLGENKGRTNRYIGITNTNSCLVAIAQDGERGAYCIINKEIENSDGKTVDLVQKFKEVSFHNNSNGARSARERTRTSKSIYTQSLGYKKKSVDISEIVHTLKTGLITSDDTGLEIHHKLYIFDHRVESSEQITKQAHKKRGNKSHRGGLMIETYEQFLELKEKL